MSSGLALHHEFMRDLVSKALFCGTKYSFPRFKSLLQSRTFSEISIVDLSEVRETSETMWMSRVIGLRCTSTHLSIPLVV